MVIVMMITITTTTTLMMSTMTITTRTTMMTMMVAMMMWMAIMMTRTMSIRMMMSAYVNWASKAHVCMRAMPCAHCNTHDNDEDDCLRGSLRRSEALWNGLRGSLRRSEALWRGLRGSLRRSEALWNGLRRSPDVARRQWKISLSLAKRKPKIRPCTGPSDGVTEGYITSLLRRSEALWNGVRVLYKPTLTHFQSISV